MAPGSPLKPLSITNRAVPPQWTQPDSRALQVSNAPVPEPHIPTAKVSFNFIPSSYFLPLSSSLSLSLSLSFSLYSPPPPPFPPPSPPPSEFVVVCNLLTSSILDLGCVFPELSCLVSQRGALMSTRFTIKRQKPKASAVSQRGSKTPLQSQFEMLNSRSVDHEKRLGSKSQLIHKKVQFCFKMCACL